MSQMSIYEFSTLRVAVDYFNGMGIPLHAVRIVALGGDPVFIFERVRSARPKGLANYAGDSWGESDRVCPKCGHLVWACIGTSYSCGDCGCSWDD